jgi:hypothetical protein
VADLDSVASATNQALGMSVGRPTGKAGYLRCAEETMAGVGKVRRGAVDAGVAAGQAGALAIPATAIAVGMGLGALAAHVFHQAAHLARRGGAGLEFVKLVLVAAVVYQLVGVKARPAQGSRSLALRLSLASKARVSSTQPGWVGQPEIFTTGSPPAAWKSPPSSPPGWLPLWFSPPHRSGCRPPR